MDSGVSGRLASDQAAGPIASATAAVIVAAVNDALAPLGVAAANHTPLTPAWVLGALARARTDGDGPGRRGIETNYAEAAGL